MSSSSLLLLLLLFSPFFLSFFFIKILIHQTFFFLINVLPFFFIQAYILWFYLIFNYFLVFHYFHEHGDNFHNSKIMEFVGLIHARLIGFWWDPTDVIFSLIDWLLCFIDLPHSMTCMRLFYICALTLSPINSTQLVSKVRLIPDCVYWFICYHVCLAFTHLIIVRYPCLINQLPYLFHLISIDPFLWT